MDNIKIGFISLGCDKNTVDSEKILAKLKAYGAEIVLLPEEADYIIINTCGFIESAKQESIDTIIEMAEYKKSHNVKKIIVTGCLATRYYEELKEQLSEADLIIRLQDYDNILALIFEDNTKYQQSQSRIITTPYHYAYLKIADGCNNRCAYCAIPSIRGKYISEPIDKIVSEAKELITTNGIEELILVAQDVTRYGIDIYREYSLLKLLDELEKLDIHWIRLMYCYPELVTKELVNRVSQSSKIASYLDIPMQHVSDNILTLMNRRNNAKDAYDLIDRIRNIDDNISIRSTFIAGFPSENEQDIDELKKFLEYAELDNCGFFAYSREENTTAYNMDNQVATDIAEQRVAELYSIQAEIVHKKHQKLIGKKFEVLYEGIDYDNQCLFGRTYQSAPDIDSKVLLSTTDSPQVGEFVQAVITDTKGIDLVAEILDED